MSTATRNGTFIGVRDRAKHKIAETARLVDYPKPPAGPGGCFAYALCGEPAYRDVEGIGLDRLSECTACADKSG